MNRIPKIVFSRSGKLGTEGTGALTSAEAWRDGSGLGKYPTRSGNDRKLEPSDHHHRRRGRGVATAEAGGRRHPARPWRRGICPVAHREWRTRRDSACSSIRWRWVRAFRSSAPSPQSPGSSWSSTRRFPAGPLRTSIGRRRHDRRFGSDTAAPRRHPPEPRGTRMIIVSGRIFTKPGQRDAFLEGSREAIAAARKAEGCHDFSVSPDLVEADRVNVYEEWQSESAMLAFRGDGPGDDLSALIERAEVRRHSVRKSGARCGPAQPAPILFEETGPCPKHSSPRPRSPLRSRFSPPGASDAYREARTETAGRRDRAEAAHGGGPPAAQRRALPQGPELVEDFTFDGLGPDGVADEAASGGPVSRDGTNLAGDLPLHVPAPRDGHPARCQRRGDREAPVEGAARPSCTALLDQLNAAAPHFEAAGGNFAVMAKTALPNLLAVARDREWKNLRLISSAGSDFDRLYHAADHDGQAPMLFTFARDPDGTVRFFWASDMTFAGGIPGRIIAPRAPSSRSGQCSTSHRAGEGSSTSRWTTTAATACRRGRRHDGPARCREGRPPGLCRQRPRRDRGP